MTETNPTLLLLAVVFLIVLAVVVFVATLAYLQRGQPNKKPRQTSMDVQPPLQPQPEPLPQEPEAAAEAEMPAHPGEVMRVVRDPRTAQILVEVDGQRYAHIREIKDAQVGRRVLWAIADLLRFTGGMAANPQAVRSISAGSAAPAAPAAGPMPARAASGPGFEPAARPFASEPSTVPATGPATDQPAQQAGVASTIAGFFRRGLQPPPAIQPVGSFVDEIEAVLQRTIRNRPTPLPCEVHVRTGQGGALQIEVGANAYQSPDQVPDPEIRELIKSAVAEWERR